MAKKSGSEPTAETPRRRVEKQNPEAVKSESLRASASPRLKSSSLLDTRVVYCGDNLEQLAKLPDACVDLIYIDLPKPMQKEKCKMMKPARSPILHSSFRLLHLTHYHCDWHASHYVK